MASTSAPPASDDGGWTSAANGYSSDDTYATTAPKKNKTKTVEYGTFGFDSTIPPNATITSVSVSVEWKVSTSASIATLGARAYVDGSPVGTELVNVDEPTSDTSQAFSVPGLTRAQLLDGAFTVRVRATRGHTNTGFSASLDAVSVTVDYTVPGSVTLTSDANGNLMAKGPDTFAYDGANRLISATVAGTTETYTYDGDGVRFSRTVGAGPAIRYVSDVNADLPVTLDDGTRTYVWGLGLAYALSGNSIEVYHADRLGSVRAITDATGAVTATYRTDEYGIPTAGTGSSVQPFTFTGEPRDATGISYLRARYYDPSLGRFMSRDTWAGVAGAPATLNRFAYVGSNPTRYTDPSGRDTVGVCVTAGFGIGPFGFDFDLCIVGSDSGQVGITGTGTAAAGLNLDAYAGLGFQASNADDLADLYNFFGVAGGSGSLGVGVQGSTFAGLGHCGQNVTGGTGAVVVGGGAGGYAGAQWTGVVKLAGPDNRECSSNAPAQVAPSQPIWRPNPYGPVDSSMTDSLGASKSRALSGNRSYSRH